MRRRAFLLAATLFAAPILSVRAEAPATAPVSALNAGLLAVMRAGKKTPFAQRYAQLAPVIGRAFDLDAILRLSVGPSWAKLPVADQTSLAAAFERFTIASYVANFDVNDGTRFDVAPGARDAGADHVVQTAIVSPNGESNRIDYVVRGAGEPRIVDVLLDGSISRVAVQRSDFRALLAGGGAAPLVKSLQAKTADLSGGAAL